ncbi:MAG: PocR ligand-binding domain-containing protein [Candidatus Vecturithrix sp.]|jgi:PAS domain S-box-containing protein|nr:PocR ligand-binding domain-containing protein [Candidatus Vecturithrix sp.]
MNIQTKLILFMAAMLLVLFVVTVGIGTRAINTIIYGLNTELLTLKLAMQVEKIETAINLLENSGAISIAKYVNQAQTEILRRFQDQIIAESERYYIITGKKYQSLLHGKVGQNVSIRNDILKEMFNTKSGATNFSEEGVIYFTVYQYLGAWDWLVGVSLPQATMFQQRHVYFKAVGFFSLFVFIGVFILVYLAGKRTIVNPLATLINMTKAIAAGNFDQSFRFPQQDEIGQLAESVHWMAQQLRRNFEQIEAQFNVIQRDMTELKQAEKALRESEGRFRSLIETTSDWVWETDSNAIYTYASPKIRELLGYEPEEVIGKTPFNLMSQEAMIHLETAFLDILANQRPFERLEKTVRHKDGRYLVLETSGVPFFDADGRLIGYRGISRDITERKRIEEALEKRIMALTQPIDTTEGIAFEDLFNLSDIQYLQDLYADAFGVAALITRPDGTPITQPSNFSELCGEIIRKTSQGAKNCHYSDAMIGQHNPSGPIIQPCLSAGLCNAGASISVGGRHIANWLIGQVRNEIQNEEEIMHYAREIGADETAFRAAYHKMPVMPQAQFEKVAQVLFVLANQLSTSAYQNVQQARFIVAHKRAEDEIRTLNTELEQRVHERTARLEAVNQELQSFAYIVSHDLKAPLRAINRLVKWLVEDYGDVFDAKGKEMAALLLGRVNRMDGLIDGILEYSRIGHIAGQVELLDLSQLLPDVIDSLSPPPNIQVIIASTLPVISGNTIRIQQVFANLIGNAVKYMDKSQGIITIRCEEVGVNWQFSVADNGPGIEPQYHNKIFQIFQTLQPRDEVESTGIGLSIVKKIVGFYGGKIWIESEVGKGTTFLFTFPKQGDR